jgi:hypothetical protein
MSASLQETGCDGNVWTQLVILFRIPLSMTKEAHLVVGDVE